MTCSCGLGELEAARGGRVPRGRAAEDIRQHIEYYMDLFEVFQQPHVRVQDNLGSKWLGRDIWDFKEPDNTTIVIQKRILGDPRTLERVVAHEMIHHSDAMELDPKRANAMIRMGIQPIGHGRDFLKKAEKVNRIKGEDFVTVQSDQGYVQESERQFFLFILPVEGDRFGYAWGARLSPANKTCVQRSIKFRDAVLVKTNDLKWTRGHKLKRCELIGIPRSAEDQAELRKFYETARKAPA
jgi:hypothetical protein